MHERIYIENFCWDLNYTRVILYIGNVNPTRLRKALEDSYVNKIYRLDFALKKLSDSARNYIYIENCDLQDLDRSIHDYIVDDYDVHILYEDNDGYYIKQKIDRK